MKNLVCVTSKQFDDNAARAETTRSSQHLAGDPTPMLDNAMIHRAIAVNYRNLALGHETFPAAGATFVRQRDLPNIYDANFIYDVTFNMI